MPYIHEFNSEDATVLIRRALQKAEKLNTRNPSHFMEVQALSSLSLRDELRLHARYIRDTLVPLLSRQPDLTQSDSVLLRSIFKKLQTTQMTLELLRYSRIEKALMVIAATGTTTVRRFEYSQSRMETLEKGPWSTKPT